MSGSLGVGGCRQRLESGRSSGAVVPDGLAAGPREVQGAGNCCDISPAPNVVFPRQGLTV